MNSASTGRLLTAIVAFLGLNMLIANIGTFILAWAGKPTPDSIIQQLGGSQTALAGFLTGVGLFYLQEKGKQNTQDRAERAADASDQRALMNERERVSANGE